MLEPEKHGALDSAESEKLKASSSAMAAAMNDLQVARYITRIR